MTNKLFSIIIPAYNCENSIEACVRSILQQEVSDFEIIIVDDGSTDRTALICDGLSVADSRIVSLHQTNCGASVARNKGLSRATGDLVLFVDSDDLLPPGALAAYRDAYANEMPDICIGHSWCNFSGKGFVEYQPFDTDRAIFSHEDAAPMMACLLDSPGFKQAAQVTSGIRIGAAGAIWGRVFSRAFLNENHIVFDPSLRRAQDVHFTAQALLSANEVCVLTDATYRYTFSKDSIARKPDPDLLEKYELFHSALKPLVTSLAYDWLVQAYYLRVVNKVIEIIARGNTLPDIRATKGLLSKTFAAPSFKEAISELRYSTMSNASGRVRLWLFKHHCLTVLALWCCIFLTN